jgi:low affinity Fe/Cu permease
MARGIFDRFSNLVSHGAGQPLTFIAACAGIAVWGISGPLFGFSETWQLVVNTGTTIITFLMVFVLQHSQNRDGAAVQAKLDELILVITKADNRLIGAENLSSADLKQLRDLIAEQVRVKKEAIERIDEAVTERREALSHPRREG